MARQKQTKEYKRKRIKLARELVQNNFGKEVFGIIKKRYALYRGNSGSQTEVYKFLLDNNFSYREIANLTGKTHESIRHAVMGLSKTASRMTDNNVPGDKKESHITKFAKSIDNIDKTLYGSVFPSLHKAKEYLPAVAPASPAGRLAKEGVIADEEEEEVFGEKEQKIFQYNADNKQNASSHQGVSEFKGSGYKPKPTETVSAPNHTVQGLPEDDNTDNTSVNGQIQKEELSHEKENKIPIGFTPSNTDFNSISPSVLAVPGKNENSQFLEPAGENAIEKGNIGSENSVPVEPVQKHFSAWKVPAFLIVAAFLLLAALLNQGAFKNQEYLANKIQNLADRTSKAENLASQAGNFVKNKFDQLAQMAHLKPQEQEIAKENSNGTESVDEKIAQLQKDLEEKNQQKQDEEQKQKAAEQALIEQLQNQSGGDKTAYVIVELPEGTKETATIETAPIKEGQVKDGKIVTQTIIQQIDQNGQPQVDQNGQPQQTIVQQELGQGSITDWYLADGSVTTAKIVAAAVTEEKLADGSVSLNKIANGTITGGKLQNYTLTGDKIANDGSVVKSIQGDKTITVTNNKDGSYNIAFKPQCNNGEILKWNSGKWGCVVETGGTYTAGSGLALSGDEFSVQLDGSSLSLGASGIKISDNYSDNFLTVNTAFSGDISGTYNSISVADDSHSHTAATLPADTSYLGSSIETGEITDDTILEPDLHVSNSPSNGQVLAYNSATGGFTWQAAGGGSGTVTQIDTGNGLTGGPIVNTGTVSINSPTCNGTDKLQWNGTAFVCSADVNTGTTYTAGSGLDLTGTTFSIPTGGVTNTMLSGSIAASKLIGTDIATVGTITSGTWNGTAIDDAHVANDITASNYLLLAGGTMTGSLNFSGVASDITTATDESLALMPNGTGNVGINTTGPDRRLDVLDASNPQLRLTRTDGTIYTDLQTNASGYLYINTSGNRIGIENASPGYTLDVGGDTNIADASEYRIGGTQVLSKGNDSLTGNLIVGDGGGSLTHGSGSQGYYNTALGINAGSSLSTGYQNVAIGYNALHATTNSLGNVSIGFNSLAANTTGYANIGIGSNSLSSSTTAYSNVAIGDATLNNASNTGYYNIAIGSSSSNYNTTGHENVAIGVGSLFYNKIGNSNIAIGRDAGSGVLNNSYSNDTFIGYQTGYSTTTGSNNLALGYQAGYTNATGANNVFLGYQAGYSETGSDKLYIDNSNTATPLVYGDFSTNALTVNGTLNTTGSITANDNDGVSNDVNITLGDANETGQIVFYDGSSNTGTLAIDSLGADAVYTFSGATGTVWTSGNDGSGSGLDADTLDGHDTAYFMASGTDNWVNTGGDTMTGALNFSGVASDITTATDESLALMPNGTGNVGINTTGPDRRLDVLDASNPQLRLTRTDGTIYTELQTNASGYLYVNASGNRVGIEDSTPSYTLDVGGDIGVADAEEYFIGTTQVLSKGNGSLTGNLIVGDGGGSLAHTGGEEGYYNMALGIGALQSTTTGAYNTAVGYRALYSNTTGNDNTANGLFALFSNTAGYFNIATGEGSLYSNTTGHENTANGQRALYSNTTGYDNTANGFYSLLNNTEGYDNTANGYRALQNNTTGSSNTAFGSEAGHFNETGSGNIFLGYQAGYSETGSNKLYIDNSNTATPLVYGDFGTDALTVYGTLNTTGSITANDNDGVSNDVNITLGDTNETGQIVFYDGSANTGTLAIDSLGADAVYTFSGASGTVYTSSNDPYDTAGEIQAVSLGGALGGTIGSATIGNNAVALNTNTTGNYVASITNGSGIAGGNGGSEEAALTLALSNLTTDWNQNGAYDVVLQNASSELKIKESTGDTFYGIFDVGDLAADSTYTFSGASGTVYTSSNDPYDTAGEIQAVSLGGALGGTIGSATIGNNAVALNTNTTGNYVASITNGSGISGGNGGSEEAALTLALGALTTDWVQSGAYDITLSNASSEIKIKESAGDTFYGTLDVGDLAADSTYTFTGPSGNVLTSTSEPVLTASGRHARRIQLNAEYAGGAITKFYGAGTDASTTGTMDSDAEPSADLLRTYYNWTSSEASLNYYTVAVRVTLPQDFDSWATSNALQIDYDTNTTTAADNALDVYVYNGDDTPGTAVASATGNVSSVADTWATATIDDSAIVSGAPPEWDAAGETSVIYLRMGAKSTNFVRVGDIKLNYLSKW